MSDRPRIALVTGGNRGIGFEVCRQLAERGFTVLLTARDADKSSAAAAKIKTTGHLEPVVLDVSDPRSIEKRRLTYRRDTIISMFWLTTPESTTTRGKLPRAPTSTAR